MTTPATTTILNEIAVRLANITTANEYNYTIKKIARAKLEPFKGYDLPAINYWCTSLSNERSVYNDDNRNLELFIEAHSLTRDDPFIDVVDKLATDIVTGLNRKATAPKVSDDPNYDLNETVSDLIFKGYDYQIGQGEKPWCGVLIRFTIVYQTNPNDMTTYAA